MGQALDLMSEDKSRQLEDFNMQRYSQIVQYKTSYYSFYLPVQLGMILVGIDNFEQNLDNVIVLCPGPRL